MSNLRVVDASVIPDVTNANLNAPVMMLAEKAAEDIINFYSDASTTDSTTTTTITTRTTTTYQTQSTPPQPNGSKSTLVDPNKLFLVSIFIYYFSNFSFNQ